MGKKRSHSKEDCPVTEKKQRVRKYNSSSSSEVEETARSYKPDKKHSRSKHKHKLKAKHKKKKRKVSSDSLSTSGSEASSISSTSFTEKKRKKLKKKVKHKLKKSKNKKIKNTIKQTKTKSDSDLDTIGPLPPVDLSENAKSMAPMTKEEWEKRQSVVKRVYDEETGRHRLVKGDGEILEEIVSRDRHKEINRQATAGDGSFFQNKIQNKLKPT